MTFDDTDLIAEALPSPTERQLRRLMVPRPAAYVTNERLDVIHDPTSSNCGESTHERPCA